MAAKKVGKDDMDFDDEDGDLKEIEGLSKMEQGLTPSQQAKSDKFCSKFCWMLWLSIPSWVQIGCVFG